jgi:hypothetical protein
MVVLMAVVVRSRHAFLGSAAASVVGVVGGGRDGPTRPFGCCAIMIAHARVFVNFGAVGPSDQWRTALPAVIARGAWSFREHGSPGSINRERGRGGSLTLPLSICCLGFLPPPSRALPQSRSCSLHSLTTAP